jgi:hypothetical protein
LLVLDNVESILQGYTPQASTGSGVTETYRFIDEYEELLQHLGQGRHQSCVLLTSREEPKRVQQLSGDHLSVRVLPIQGLQLAEAQQIFRDRGVFQGSRAELSRLITYYNGNPFILEILATTIQHLFDGSITAFLSQNTLIFDDIRELLDQQFDYLSEPEKDVMKVLAVQDIPLSFADLRSHISPSISTAVLLAALKSLKARSLLERTASHSSLQPLLRDYVSDHFGLSS